MTLTTTLVISTHLDDAVLSCGNHLAAAVAPTVLTVFTDAPPVERTDGWNHHTTGETFAPDSQRVRRIEDAEALAALGAEPAWLGLYEAEYRPHGDHDGTVATVRAALAEFLTGFLDQQPAAEVWVPLGLHHPDHLAVADACLELSGVIEHRRWRVYLDMPYAQTFPDEVTVRLGEVGRRHLLDDHRRLGPTDGKATALAAYASQLDAVRSEHPDLDAAVLDPERSWRLTSPGGTDPTAAASTVG